MYSLNSVWGGMPGKKVMMAQSKKILVKVQVHERQPILANKTCKKKRKIEVDSLQR